MQHRRGAPRSYALAPTSAIALLLLLRVVGRAAGAGAAPAAKGAQMSLSAAVKGAQMSLSAAQAARTTEVQRSPGAPCMRIMNRHVSWQHAHGLSANLLLTGAYMYARITCVHVFVACGHLVIACFAHAHHICPCAHESVLSPALAPVCPCVPVL